MRTLSTVSKIVLLAIIIAVCFVSIQQKEFSINTIMIGIVHGVMIGTLLGLLISLKNQVLYFYERRAPFVFVIILHSILYLGAILVGRAIGMMITKGKSLQIIPENDPNFMGAVIFIFCTILIYNLLEQISLLTGQKQLINFAIGRYSNAQMESRMIMFLDMKDSTKIAERIGDEKYLSLLDEFFSLMSIPLNESNGEIYKYIGDEAIITWHKNLQDAKVPAKFYFKFKQEILNHADQFMENYQVVPTFKAGLHYGNMMIGELGSVKKEIALIGDSLNTTSRILAKAKSLNKELILSELLGKQFKDGNYSMQVENLGLQQLRGKEEPIKLYSISKRLNSSKSNPKKFVHN